MKTLKRIAAALCIFALVIAAVPVVEAEAATVYHVSTVRQLKAVGTKYLNAVVYLDKDLDLESAEWTPIGTDDAPFTGKFIGQGHVIKNLKVTKTEYNAGLFGVTKGATIKDLMVTGKVKYVNTYGGGIVGHATSGTVLSYCVSKVYVSGINQIGGIVGRISDSEMKYCLNCRTVTATTRGCGGITADLYPSGTLTKCINLADVIGGTDLTGGITGGSTSGTVSGCVQVGNVTSKGGRIGAIAGDNASYAGARYVNYFRQTSTVNADLTVVGTGGTFKSSTGSRVTPLKDKILATFD